jgi:predicted AAA+ superfamily ATPase
MYISRAMESVVQKATGLFPVVLVTGPRQVGKTTMLEKLTERSRTYVSLDAPLIDRKSTRLNSSHTSSSRMPSSA